MSVLSLALLASLSAGAEPESLVVAGPASRVRVRIDPTDTAQVVRVEVDVSGDEWCEFRAVGRDHREVDCLVGYQGVRDNPMGFTALELRPAGTRRSKAMVKLIRQDDGNVSVWVDEDQDGLPDAQGESAFTWGEADDYLPAPGHLVGVAAESFAGGLAAAGRGDLEQAMTLFRASLAAQPTPEAAFNLTVLLTEIGDPAEALDTFRRHQELLGAARSTDGELPAAGDATSARDSTSTPWVERAIEARPRQAETPPSP